MCLRHVIANTQSILAGSLFVVALFLGATAEAQNSVSVTELFQFPSDTSDGYLTSYNPGSPLLQASDDNLYGTAWTGGDDGSGCAHLCTGTIFKITLAGAFMRLYTFAYGNVATPYANGQNPSGGLVEGPDSYLYGVTENGGNYGYGVVYKVSKDGQQFQKLYDFCQQSRCADGANPMGNLVVGSDGALYGTTSSGGSSGNCANYPGTIYKITTEGTFTKLIDISGASCAAPLRGLVLATDGYFYGMTYSVIYRLKPPTALTQAQLTTIYTFGSIQNDGANGYAPLIQASDGRLYGVTDAGGVNHLGIVFRISLDGIYEKVLDFDSTIARPVNYPLLQATDGNFWSTTFAGGSSLNGSIYSITPGGALVQSTFFPGCQSDGTGWKRPFSPLIQASNGKLHGTDQGCTGYGSILVVDAGLRGTLQSISVSPATASVPDGLTQQLTATGHYSDSSTQDLRTSVTWSSSNTSIATISNTAGSQGLTTGVSPGGPVTITATQNSISGTAQVTVTAPVLVSIALTPADRSVPAGSTQQFTATGTYSNGSTQNITGSVTWASSNSTVATISASGLASALAAGTTTISAQQGSVSNSTSMTVITLQGLTISPANPSIFVGSTLQFSAIGHYSDGSTRDLTSAAVWTSSRTSVATITAGGLAAGVAKGSTTITARVGAFSASTALKVHAVTLQSITVSPATATISVGGTQHFTATGNYNNGSTSDLTNKVTWSSSPKTVSSVTNSGLATGIKAGTATITAKSGISGSATLTVQ